MGGGGRIGEERPALGIRFVIGQAHDGRVGNAMLLHHMAEGLTEVWVL